VRTTGNVSDRYEGREPRRCKPKNQHTAEARRRKRWPRKHRTTWETPPDGAET